MSNDPISQALNILPEPTKDLPAVVEPELIPAVSNTSDIELAQKNLKELADKGKEALDQMLEVANLSQHPRAYEVVSQLIGQLAQVNRTLLDGARTRKDVEGTANTAGKTVNNNLFVGSTAELLKLIKKQGQDVDSG